MTTTTADKGEQECREAFEDWFNPDNNENYWDCWNAAIAWSRRPANEGQDGLAEDVQAVVSGLQSFLDRVIHHSETGVIHPELYESDCDTLRSAITHLRHLDRARHLSSKQADSAERNFCPTCGKRLNVNDVSAVHTCSPPTADHIVEANKMVKADAVKMPEPVLLAKGNRFDTYGYTEDHLQAYATAHTAEAIRELVEGLRDASKDMRAAALTIDDNPGGAINDTIWHGMVTLYDHLCASAEQVERTLAKYAPSQEGKNGG